MEVTFVEAFMEASVEVTFVEAFMEASVEAASVEASVEAFMEASVEVNSLGASTKNFRGKFHGSFHASMEAFIASMEASRPRKLSRASIKIQIVQVALYTCVSTNRVESGCVGKFARSRSMSQDIVQLNIFAGTSCLFAMPCSFFHTVKLLNR